MTFANAAGMKLAICLLFATILAKGQPPPGYYDPAMGLSGPELKTALYGIINPHTVRSYAQLWSDFQSTDDRDDNGKVWDIYSDIPDGAAPYLYTFGTDQCGTYNGEGDCYNREHTVPQSWFNGASPMYTDLHHLYPVDGWVNNKRGDLPYGDVGSADWTSQNGTQTGNSATPGYSGTVCEPIDAFKGDIARTYFYMMTCYQPNVAQWSSDMFTGGDLSAWAKDMLVVWDENDPVSQKEIDRNNAVFAIQNNRNPYIDHPEWVHLIWQNTTGIHESTDGNGQFWVSAGAIHRASTTGQATVSITDATGRRLFTTTFTGASLPLPETLPSGVYLAFIGNKVVRFVR